jgi:parvulin-like peptidyl-prolyl isomerase
MANRFGSVGVGVAACAVLLLSCDAGGGDGAVARAGEHELSATQMAGWFALGASIPLQRNLAERVAHRWVDYTLFADRIAAGDSLLDSTTVLDAMWPEVYERLVGLYHEQLVADRIPTDSAAIDSVYAVGDYRLIWHILVRSQPTMPAADKEAARARAEALRTRLVAGEPWEVVNAESEDPGAQQQGGSLGVIARGVTVPEFEVVAFMLEPGQLSQVTASQFGYHIIRRPRLEEVRAEFSEALPGLLVQEMDMAILEDVDSRWNLEARSSAPSMMREAAAAPLRAIDSDEVIASYRGGRFTVADFVRWLAALPPQMQGRIEAAGDDQLKELATGLTRNELLVREAKEAGVRVSDEEYGAYRERLQGEVQTVRAALGLDSVLAGVETTDERRTRVDEAVEAYIVGLVTSGGDGVMVPVFLAGALRTGERWNVWDRGLDLALERAQLLRMEAAPPDAGEPPPGAASDSVVGPGGQE